MRVLMIVASARILPDQRDVVARRPAMGNAAKMNFEAPLTSLVWLTSIVSVITTYIASYFLIITILGDGTLWWKLSTVITCGTLAGAHHPRVREGLHLHRVQARVGRS